MNIEKMDGTLLTALRKAMQFNIATMCQILDKPIAARTWQKYESGDLNIPDKVVEQVYNLCYRYHEIKSSGVAIQYSKSLNEFSKLGIPTQNMLVDWKLHQAVFCSEIVESIVFTLLETDGKLPRVQRIPKAETLH
jgi:hypothetical protein